MLIPTDTQLKCGFRYNFQAKCPELVFNPGSSAVIRGAIISGDKIFEKDMISYFSPQPGPEYIVPIFTEKDHPSMLHIKLFMGNSINSKEFKIIEVEKSVPKFFMFSVVDANMPGLVKSTGSVKCKLRERSPRVTFIHLSHTVDENVVDQRLLNFRAKAR